MEDALTKTDAPTAHTVERMFNWMVGGTIVWWTGAGLMAATSFAPVHLAIGGLNLVVAGLFIAREPEQRGAGLGSILTSLPGVLCGGLALHLATVPSAWPIGVQALYALGAMGAAVSLSSLGRSFSVLPSVRTVVDRGPYAWVRHPAYAAQLLMVLAVSMLLGGVLGVGMFVATAVALAMRITAEERLLVVEPDYRAYRSRVQWRMLPGVW